MRLKKEYLLEINLIKYFQAKHLSKCEYLKNSVFKIWLDIEILKKNPLGKDNLFHYHVGFFSASVLVPERHSSET